MTSEPSIAQSADGDGGIFGRWIVDENGLPAYEYTFDQYSETDKRAQYPTTDGYDHRDHWHQVGNRRVTALASNDGIVQVYLADRGGTFLNRFEAHEIAQPATKISGGLLAFLAGLVQRFVRFLALLGRSSRNTVQPFNAAAQTSGSDFSQNPRNMPPLEILKKSNMTSKSSRGSAGKSTPLDTQRFDAPQIQPQILAQPQQHRYAGGFSYIDDGGDIWATAYRYRPQGAATRRLFGVGYFQAETTHRNIRVTRRVYAPHGDEPVVLSEVRIENLGDTPAQLKHYEYWDVNKQQLRLEWLRGGTFGAASDQDRRALNERFPRSIQYHPAQRVLIFKQQTPSDAPPPEEASAIDWYPSPVFLADLSGEPTAHYVNREAFFGAGGARRPDVAVSRQGDTPIPLDAGAMPYCMVLRRDLNIPPQQSVTLRYAYGAAQLSEVSSILNHHSISDAGWKSTSEAWRRELVSFKTGQDATLERELAWHTYNLLSATTYNEFHQAHVIPQGSAYLYLHGADGAPRDQALFAMPTTYLDANLAKDMLRLIMQLTDLETSQIPYAFAGHGHVSNALNIHNEPSDLDLFFLLAITEYLSATGDMSFLNEDVRFYSPSMKDQVFKDTVLNHIRLAVQHIFRGLSTDQPELLRIGSGDWSDSIVLQTALADGLLGTTYDNSKAHGNSVPNSQMALYVLPLLANILKVQAPDVGEYIHDGRLERLHAAVDLQWNTKLGHYNRAVLRDLLNQPVTITRFDLEAQVWGLVSGAAKESSYEAELIENIDTVLDRPSSIGALLMPGQPYKMVWPAISQLLTWGYARAGRAELAWRSFNRNTFAAHARNYPHIWFGIWSAPDGIHGVDDENPKNAGYTWETPSTPMSDFPVMNANPDAMSLLGLLRVCGIEPAPSGDGLIIKPAVPRERFVLEMPLLRLEVEKGRIRGEYRAQTDGQVTLYLTEPTQQKPTVVKLVFKKGDKIPFQSED